jgi:hypothetical protein
MLVQSQNPGGGVQERFEANFIPHDPGRHRVDVKFNGEKVPNSPWFVEVKAS